jgi:dipeptidase E
MGQLAIIQARVAAGVPYGGSSAGANVAGLLIGTTNDFPVAEIPSRRALGIFPAVINPHHPAPSALGDFDYRAEKINNYLGFNPTEIVLGLGNGAMARLHDGRVTLEAGLGWVYQVKSRRSLVPGDLIPELLLKK